MDVWANRPQGRLRRRCFNALPKYSKVTKGFSSELSMVSFRRTLLLRRKRDLGRCRQQDSGDRVVTGVLCRLFAHQRVLPKRPRAQFLLLPQRHARHRNQGYRVPIGCEPIGAFLILARCLIVDCLVLNCAYDLEILNIVFLRRWLVVIDTLWHAYRLLWIYSGRPTSIS